MNIVITGGTSGLGYRTAFILAQDSKNKIILIGKNKAKGEQAIKSLNNETNNKNLSFLQVDLSSIFETSSLKEKLANKKIDVLINNAGALFYSRIESEDGIEKTFALNHLSYFILSNLLLKHSSIDFFNPFNWLNELLLSSFPETTGFL